MAARDEFLFLALGGAGEIGMNLNLYGFGPPADPTWLMVDLGITFDDGTAPGADVLMADPQFIVDRRDRLAGLVLTHAHEDHLGAVPYLWDRLRCPVYATPFTAALLKRKLLEDGGGMQVPLTIVELGSRFTVGPFDLELITLTHSIPEPNAIAIRTPLGTVLHTGDWKFDPTPVVGDVADEDALRALGDSGVLALVGDSTNALVDGESGSESDVAADISRLIAEARGRVVVTCFASNVARLQTIITAAHAAGRDVVLAGRSMKRIVSAARETGYLPPQADLIDEKAADRIPRDRALILCTGSQGEPQAALGRIAAQTHGHIVLERGDRVIYSSREIPGNENAIARIQNLLLGRGIEVITTRDAHVHVSGHPARDELARMYALARPALAIPVHGELRHMQAHAALARDCQVPKAIIAPNGTLVRLAPGKSEVIDEVPTGRLALDGKRLVATAGEVVRSRTRVMMHGAAVATVPLDRKGKLAGPIEISVFGLLEETEEADKLAAGGDAIAAALAGVSRDSRAHDEELAEAARVALRRYFRDTLGKNPVVRIHLVRA
ncbi:MAG: ribonuclease J [Proteobacteria bacterium]|nr:ribonuclease J [Pseudomonadota bacterium]